MNQVEMPTVDAVADAAKRILDSIKSDPEFGAFRTASLEYSEDWQCFTGFPVVARWSLEADAVPLFEEGLSALALKAAVFEATGDDQVAEIAIAVPVDATGRRGVSPRPGTGSTTRRSSGAAACSPACTSRSAWAVPAGSTASALPGPRPRCVVPGRW
ncbi:MULTISPECIES: hypothetical protein [unclassified Streptomyces]|uniref:hypothetical protein n=1 Tax=unclassified Streptomyces TaxID=2593676 RepID=UPI00214BC1B8|nr:MULTISPECIES: hypothetical protein [unclassified Streptomyces]